MYDHKTIDKKWQEKWETSKIYLTPADPKNKKYILDMFPYPSGAGLHVGHPEGYTASDILARYFRMNGFDILHPMGWDAFGLPAENYAIKQGEHPAITTKRNIDKFREQIKSIGLSYDWGREINTSDPLYYKWTQWLFLQLYKNGLAYKKEAYVNWCPKDCTVLANEQVIGGKCERCGSEVEQKLLSQWFFKITDYAERLLADLSKLDWPEPIKQMQKNWIGKSEGALIKFPVLNSQFSIDVFTTRPDTLYGATYVVLAPDHKLVSEVTTADKKKHINDYVAATKGKSELERTALEKEKTGVFTGSFATNPATNEQIPIWIADYVLASYGTGAIMAVPAHDERDFEFAKKYQLLIKKVIQPIAENESLADCWTGDGLLINSEEFDGMESKETGKKIAEKFGTASVQFKLRDWLVSRQRYWGAPIPIIYCETCGMQPVPEDQLPVKLPTDVDFKPTGESPLARSAEFQNAICPKCGKAAKRDVDTMDTFVDSSWYYLRYSDPYNEKELASSSQISKWMPVDHYQGGAEHAVLHLLYSRFITKALKDFGFLNFDEPFKKLRNQGLILGPDGEKMSKSRGNVINPDDVISEFGADVFRMYEMFMGPLEDAKPWSTQGIVGLRRFLEKIYKLSNHVTDVPENKSIHKLIKRISSDIEALKFNTAIAFFMEYLNKHKNFNTQDWGTILKLLAPFAPHIAEELWEKLGNTDSIHKQSWPKFDEVLVKDELVTIVVQISGKTRASFEAEHDLSEESAKQKALEIELIKKYIEGKEVAKQIYVQNKLINFVIK